MNVRMPPGLVGRTVSFEHRFKDGTKTKICEVVACQAAGDYGSWRLLLATSEGKLISTDPEQVTLVADPSGGPYR